jgi:hypothetical protein
LAHQDTIIAAAPRKVYANGKKSKPWSWSWSNSYLHSVVSPRISHQLYFDQLGQRNLHLGRWLANQLVELEHIRSIL